MTQQTINLRDKLACDTWAKQVLAQKAIDDAAKLKLEREEHFLKYGKRPTW
jgi:hypothetical protein